MAHAPTGTKLTLILAAGELFAERGLDGASVRAIAEKAGANVAAISYHFGSKENLYTEVLRYVIAGSHLTKPSALLEQDDRLNTPEGTADVIYQIIKEEYTPFFQPGQPRWYGRLIMRSMLDMNASLQTIVEQVMRPEHEATKAIVLKVKPDMTDEEARLWAFAFIGQIAFYEFARIPILMLLGRKDYESRFLDKVRDHLARTIIAGLGLPQPKGRG